MPTYDDKYLVDSADMVDVADAIRAKASTQNLLVFPAGWLSTIRSIPTGAAPNLQSKTASPTESQQLIEPDVGYDGLSEVTVGAISSSYVGSGIDRRGDLDISVSGPTVTVPSGYYQSSTSKSVANGTAGTPTAEKGNVSNHSVTVTPSVTNTSGYISGGTLFGNAVSVSASELVSGNLPITSNGTNIDVGNYATVDVSVSGGGSGSVTQDANGYLILSDQGGGSGGGDTWTYMGKNPTKLQEWSNKYTFADLDLDNWTWSTTQYTLLAAQNLSPTISYDVSTYTYVALTKAYVYYDYGTWTPVNTALSGSYVSAMYSYRYYSNTAALQSEIPSSNSSAAIGSSGATYYNSSSGVLSIASSLMGGITLASGSMTISTASTGTLTCKTPAIRTIGNNYYFSETAFNNLDFGKSYVEYILELWRIDANSDMKNISTTLSASIINNGLGVTS